MAQPGSALAWGASGRPFKSARPDSRVGARHCRAPTTTAVSRRKLGCLAPRPGGTFAAVLILVSNDDGIRAAGIRALEAALAPLGRRLGGGAGPRAERRQPLAEPLSAVAGRGRSTTRHFAVDGTPTDAVNLAINGIMKQQARPGRLRHQPRRQPGRRHHLFRHGVGGHGGHAARRAVDRRLAGLRATRPISAPRRAFAAAPRRAVVERGMPRDTLLNVNVPGAAGRRAARLRRSPARASAAMATRSSSTSIRAAASTTGSAATTSASCPPREPTAPRWPDGYISITPLHLDLTNYASIAGS